MEEGPVEKKHRRTIHLIGYEIIVTQIDRADQTDIGTYIMYCEAENISQVYRHIIRKKFPPKWLGNLKYSHPMQQKWFYIYELDDEQLKDFFKCAYSMMYQSPDDNYRNKFIITVREWRKPKFEQIC